MYCFQLPKFRSNENRHENMCKCVTKQSNCKFNVNLAIPTPQFSSAQISIKQTIRYSNLSTEKNLKVEYLCKSVYLNFHLFMTRSHLQHAIECILYLCLKVPLQLKRWRVAIKVLVCFMFIMCDFVNCTFTPYPFTGYYFLL
jgi:hypothetical protein